MTQTRRRPDLEVRVGGSGRVPRFLLPLMLLVVAIGLYFTTFRQPLILDDARFLQGQVDATSPEGLAGLWFHDYQYGMAADHNFYRPITILTYQLQARTIGLSGPACRSVNLGFLAVLGCVAALWMGRYMHPIAAWMAALLMVAHPANSELIHLVVGRADLLALLGTLAFLYLQRRMLEARALSPLVGALAVAAAVVAVGSKESGLILIPLALVQAWLPRGDEPSSGSRRALAWSACLVLPLLAYLVGRGVAVGWTVHYEPTAGGIAGNPLLAQPAPSRLPASLSIAWLYVTLVLWPAPTFNQVPASLPTWASPAAWLGLAVVLTAAGGLIWAWRKRSWLSLPLVLGLGQYALVGNLFSPVGVYAASRLALPFTCAAACLGGGLFERLTRGSPRRRAMAVIPVGIVVAAMASAVTMRNRAWTDELGRRGADLEAQPTNPVAMYHFGMALARQGQYAEAIRWLRDAQGRGMDSADLHRDLASVYLDNHEPALAVEQLEEALKHAADPWATYLALGRARLALGEADRAEEALLEAERLAPNSLEAKLALAEADKARGRYHAAAARYRGILIHDPGNNEVQRLYEEAQEAAGEPPAATTQP